MAASDVSMLSILFHNNIYLICLLFTGTFNATLKFVVKDCDPSTGLPDSDEGYDDEYMVSVC